MHAAVSWLATWPGKITVAVRIKSVAAAVCRMVNERRRHWATAVSWNVWCVSDGEQFSYFAPRRQRSAKQRQSDVLMCVLIPHTHHTLYVCEVIDCTVALLATDHSLWLSRDSRTCLTASLFLTSRTHLERIACPLASPAMGHWGTCPPGLPASYFGDHSLYRLTSHAHGFLSSRAFSGHRFCGLSLDCGSALQPLQMGEGSGVQFSSGSNYSSQNAGTIANKFQPHTYFRFR